MLPQHLVDLFQTKEHHVDIVVDNARRPEKSVTEALRKRESISQAVPLPVDLPPVAPLSPSKRRYKKRQAPPSALSNLPSCVPLSHLPPLSVIKKQAVSSSPVLPRMLKYSKKKVNAKPRESNTKSLSCELNAVKTVSRWDSGCVFGDDCSSSTESVPSLSALAMQSMQNKLVLRRTVSALDNNNKASQQLPLRLPTRRESIERFDTATMIGKVLDELDLIDSEDADDEEEDIVRTALASSA